MYRQALLGWLQNLAGNTARPKVTTESYTTKEAKREILTPNVEKLITFTAPCAKVDVLNIGPGDIFVDTDAAAAVNGADDIKVTAGMGYTVPVVCTVLHVIGTQASEVQAVGVR
jgi:hypothetical protein